MTTKTYTFYVEVNSTNVTEITEKSTKTIKYWQSQDFGAPWNSGQDGGHQNCNMSKPGDRLDWPISTISSNTGSNPSPPMTRDVYYNGQRGPIENFDELKYCAGNRITLSKLLSDSGVSQPNNVCAVWHETSFRYRRMDAKCSKQGEDYFWSDPTYCTNLLNKYYPNKCHYSNHNYIDQGDRKVPYLNFQNWGGFLSVFNPVLLIGVGCTSGLPQHSCKGMSNDPSGMFYSNVSASTYAPNIDSTQTYFPICGFETWNGHTGSCNVCCQAQFEVQVDYYTLRAHTIAPSAQYTAATNEFTAGYFDVFPFSPSSLPEVYLGQNLTTMPEITGFTGNIGNMNFKNTTIDFATSDNDDLNEFLENQKEYELYAIWKVTYSFSSNDFQTENFQYLLYHFLILQQDLLNMSTSWFRESKYTESTIDSITQLLIDYCNAKKDMSEPLCGAENLNFSFLREPPCTTNPINCMSGWKVYCNNENNFFSPLCQYVYNNSYDSSGVLNANMQAILQSQCERYSSQVDEKNLTSDFLSVCGCFLSQDTYNKILDANPTFSEAVGGYDKRQCWYSPCIYSNVKPVVPQMMKCNDNEITNCVQRTVINLKTDAGDLYDNNVMVNSYANHCGPNPNAEVIVTPKPTDPPTPNMVIDETPSEGTVTPSEIIMPKNEELPTEAEKSIIFYFKMTNFIKSILIGSCSILFISGILFLIKKKFLNKKQGPG